VRIFKHRLAKNHLIWRDNDYIKISRDKIDELDLALKKLVEVVEKFNNFMCAIEAIDCIDNSR
jgi:hypothetical protein